MAKKTKQQEKIAELLQKYRGRALSELAQSTPADTRAGEWANMVDTEHQRVAAMNKASTEDPTAALGATEKAQQVAKASDTLSSPTATAVRGSSAYGASEKVGASDPLSTARKEDRQSKLKELNRWAELSGIPLREQAELSPEDVFADLEGSDSLEFQRFMDAIGGQESGWRTDIPNKRTGAYGTYQIMPFNWYGVKKGTGYGTGKKGVVWKPGMERAPGSSWTAKAAKAYGLPEDALLERTPLNQYLVARWQMKEYYDDFSKFGEGESPTGDVWGDIAAAWYGGHDKVYKARQAKIKTAGGETPLPEEAAALQRLTATRGTKIKSGAAAGEPEIGSYVAHAREKLDNPDLTGADSRHVAAGGKPGEAGEVVTAAAEVEGIPEEEEYFADRSEWDATQQALDDLESGADYSQPSIEDDSGFDAAQQALDDLESGADYSEPVDANTQNIASSETGQQPRSVDLPRSDEPEDFGRRVRGAFSLDLSPEAQQAKAALGQASEDPRAYLQSFPRKTLATGSPAAVDSVEAEDSEEVELPPRRYPDDSGFGLGGTGAKRISEEATNSAVSKKISYLKKKEGKPHDQAVAIALSMKKRGDLGEAKMKLTKSDLKALVMEELATLREADVTDGSGRVYPRRGLSVRMVSPEVARDLEGYDPDATADLPAQERGPNPSKEGDRSRASRSSTKGDPGRISPREYRELGSKDVNRGRRPGRRGKKALKKAIKRGALGGATAAGAAGAVGPAVAVVGAGLTGYEAGKEAMDRVLPDDSPLRGADGEVYGVTDLDLAAGEKYQGSKEGDTSGLKANPKKGWNPHKSDAWNIAQKRKRNENKMKLTKNQLKTLIQEELAQMRLEEQFGKPRFSLTDKSGQSFSDRIGAMGNVPKLARTAAKAAAADDPGASILGTEPDSDAIRAAGTHQPQKGTVRRGGATTGGRMGAEPTSGERRASHVSALQAAAPHDTRAQGTLDAIRTAAKAGDSRAMAALEKGGSTVYPARDPGEETKGSMTAARLKPGQSAEPKPERAKTPTAAARGKEEPAGTVYKAARDTGGAPAVDKPQADRKPMRPPKERKRRADLRPPKERKRGPRGLPKPPAPPKPPPAPHTLSPAEKRQRAYDRADRRFGRQMTRRGKRADRLRGRAAKLMSRADALREALEGLNLEELVNEVENEVVNELNNLFQQKNSELEEAKELSRWAELAGLSETSTMASGGVAGAAGVSPDRDDDDDLNEQETTTTKVTKSPITGKPVKGTETTTTYGGMSKEEGAAEIAKSKEALKKTTDAPKTRTGSTKSRASSAFDELEEAKDTSFSEAGEEIERKGTEGVFTAKAKRAGMGVQQYADHVLKKGSGASAKTKKQAAFAKGAATVARENK